QSRAFSDPGQEGTGLGLPLTKRLVELHGGTLTLRSAPGAGTTITARLPAERTLTFKTLLSPTEIPELTVLAVDDDEQVRMLATDMLTDIGLNVLSAANANEALLHLQGDDKIDLLFTDVVMPPGMNGVELAKIATTRWPRLKVLLASGFAGH